MHPEIAGQVLAVFCLLSLRIAELIGNMLKPIVNLSLLSVFSVPKRSFVFRLN